MAGQHRTVHDQVLAWRHQDHGGGALDGLWRVKIVEVCVGRDSVLLLFFVLKLLVVFLLTVLLNCLLVATLGHVQVLLFIVIVGNRALSTLRIECEYFSSHLKSQSPYERTDDQVLFDKHQRSKLAFVVLKQEPPIFKVVDDVGVVPRDRDVVRYLDVNVLLAPDRHLAGLG